MYFSPLSVYIVNRTREKCVYRLSSLKSSLSSFKINRKVIKFLDLQAITMMHGDEIKAAVNRVVESGWFLQGKENQQFEADYARYIGTAHCVAVANGLDALKLILRGYKEMGVMQEGDEIIVPANTYIATILAITENNLVPVLVEPTFEHLEIDIDQIELLTR